MTDAQSKLQTVVTLAFYSLIPTCVTHWTLWWVWLYPHVFWYSNHVNNSAQLSWFNDISDYKTNIVLVTDFQTLSQQ